ncbi:EAL domain-containing protein [Oribacterium sp. WCC10]|uniref:EAL domain-containing protein n=1 Tax=Oribacterium sp. WCC10 TaxID=1855343 RepID=UPI0008EDEC33|nr:EAL domain-containing protein [Oribacterium sp. WCC10]SFG21418.1 diguanylate cyclase (GGDEF) domain-containing protein [Oribacterium sp. WCC10]
MKKYRYSDEELAFLESSAVPFAVYQFINKRVVTIVLSKGFIELFGYRDMKKSEVYELMDNNMYKDTHPDDLASLGDAAYRFATEGGVYDVIYRSKREGQYRIIHSYGRHIEKENGVRLAFVWYTDQGAFVGDGKNEKDGLLNALKNQLTERSINIKIGHDYLTGLPSMSYFFELAEAGCREIRKNGRIPVILFMDFNGLKVYNQKYGIEEGDKYLKSFADKVIELFSHENCSRFNADHFCVYTDDENAENAAEKLIKSKFGMDSNKGMTLRIGIYYYEDESISISGACDRAKIACDSGRKNYISNIYTFNPKMMTEIEERQYVVENIDRAISDEWIRIFYQPIIRTANGRVCHEEALARWIDPKKGFFSPAAFIPALEESNTIYKLDLYVVDTVLKKMKVQAERGLYVVPISVNLSRSDFYTCDIVEEIRKRVDASGIARDRLVIEITESIVANDIDYMFNEIKRFKDLGFDVWMDDYGSGYSSPLILHKIPFDLIKIDMMFVRQLDDGDKAKIILTEIVRMAMSLGMDTVAEGVETTEQAEFLKDIGCTMLQGYYFCKPVSLEDIIDRYEKGVQIGFENPLETDYYSRIGKVNFYNLSFSSSDDDKLKNYFDTWPMIMVECKDQFASVIRANDVYKKFFKENFPDTYGKLRFDTSRLMDKPGAYSMKAVMKVARDGKRVIVDDITIDGKMIQLFVCRVAVNPVNGVSAVMIVILSASDVDINTIAGHSDKEMYRISGKRANLQQDNKRVKQDVNTIKKISELKESVDSLLKNMPAMTFSKDVTTGVYLACNQAFADYAHKPTPEEVVGLTDYEIFDENTARHFVEDDKKALSMDKPYIFFEDVPDAAGNPQKFQTTKLKFVDNTGRQCLLGMCQDVTDAMRIKREYLERIAQAQNKAQIDTLTGIKNKNAYQEMESIINHRIADKRQPCFAITILDMNDLKKINDTKGHRAGDECICEACNIICRTFKHSEVFRVGGDEFVAVSQGTDYEQIDSLINTIAAHNEDALFNDGVVIACGMSKYKNDNDICVADVFTRADRRMYKNKSNLKKFNVTMNVEETDSDS